MTNTLIEIEPEGVCKECDCHSGLHYYGCPIIKNTGNLLTKEEAWKNFVAKNTPAEEKPETIVNKIYCLACGIRERFEEANYCSICLIGKSRDAEKLEKEKSKWQNRFLLVFMLLIGAIVIYFFKPGN